MKYLVLCLFITISGCNLLPIDECAGFKTGVEQLYCRMSKEVTALRRATKQSLLDGSINLEQAKKAAEILTRADSVLDKAEIAITAGNLQSAETQLILARQILLETKQ